MSQKPPLIAILTDQYVGYPKVFVDRIATVLEKSGLAVVCVAGHDLSSESLVPSLKDATDLVDRPINWSVCNNIFSLAQKMQLNGVICLSGNIGLRIDPLELEKFLHRFDVPKVSLGIRLPSVPSVVVDDTRAMVQLMEHLTDDGGRSKYAFVRGFPNDTYSMHREKIFRQVLQQHGVTINEDCFIEGNYDPYDTYQAVGQLLSEHPDIDAIVAANDIMALGVARAVEARGLSIPMDIVVTGFDDTEEATQNSPAITTVRQPLAGMAESSARLMLQLLESDGSSALHSPFDFCEEVVTVSSELVIRGSTLNSLALDQHALTDVENSLCSRLEYCMSGLIAPVDFDIAHLAAVLLETLDTGSTAFEDCVALYMPQQSNIDQRHWWSNLWHQVDVHSKQMMEERGNTQWVAMVSATLAKAREYIWSASLGFEFEVRRLESKRSDMQLQMSSATTIQDILGVLSRWLKTQGAKRNYLIRFDEPSALPREKAVLIHAYSKDEYESSEPIQFYANSLLPDEYARELNAGLVILHPVYAGDQLFGYFLLDPEGLEHLRIDDIAQSIGNAMRNNHFISKLELQTFSLRKANRELLQLASFDSLTNLPNRREFQDHLTALCQDGFQMKGNFYVLFVDLDGFKEVNDTLGHDVGDILLIEVAERLRAFAQSTEFGGLYISRLGGDEFTLTFQPANRFRQIGPLSKELLGIISKPYNISSQQVSVSASMGCANYPHDGTATALLLKRADMAMYRAKKLGKNRVAFFDAVLDFPSGNTGKNDDYLKLPEVIGSSEN